MSSIKKIFKYIIVFVLFVSVSFAVEKDIPVKIDMTVLWGAELPENVYMFAYNVDGGGNALPSDIHGLTNEMGNTMGRYKRGLRGTQTEQDVSKALKLTDENGDGFYEGTLSYDGAGKTFHTKFYVANDEYNIVNMPKYESHTGPDDTPISDNVDFRTITIEDDGTINIGWDGSKEEAENGIIETAWENKSVNSLEWSVKDQGDISVYENFTRDIQVLAKYNNTKEDHRLEITEYLNWSSNDENIFEIYKIGTIKGVQEGNSELKIQRGDKSLFKNIEVIKMTEMEKRQYVMAISGNQFKKGMYGIKGMEDGDYSGEVKNKEVSGALQDDIYNNSEFGQTPLMRQGDQGSYHRWEKGNDTSTNVIYIPRELNNDTEMESLEIREEIEGIDAISQGKLIAKPKIPVKIRDVFVQKNSNGNSFSWTESKFSEYKESYDRGQDIFFRVSKIDTESSDVSFFEGNPLKKVEEHIQDYKDGTIKYIDFFFDYNKNETIAKDGITGEYVYENFELSGLPLGEYRLQIYTLKKSSDYFVFSFDEEVSFQTPQDPVGGLQVEDNYIFESIDAKFFSEIKINFLTRTKEDINLTKEDISYNDNSGTLGERHYGNGGETETSIEGEFSLQESSDLDVIEYPLDIILCLDTSSSMSNDLDKLKGAWGEFEEEVSQKSGFDVNYKLITFGNTNDSDIWIQGNEDEWFDTLDLTSINTGSGDSSQEPSAEAILKATQIMEDYGRSMDDNWNIINDPSGDIKSQKMIIFVTDSNTKSENPTPDTLAKKIVEQNIFLTGIGGVKKDGLMIEDDLEDTGYYPENKNSENEQHYYHLKLILGDRFKFYQMGNTSNKYELQLKESISRMPIIKKWTLSYFSPYSLPDGKTRKILFDVSDLKYHGKSDRKYIAPYRETTEEPANQTIVLKFDQETKDKLTETDYKYYLSDNKSLWNTFRNMKTVDLGDGIQESIEELNYADSGNFSLIQSDNDRQWEYNGSSGTVNGMLVNKVSSLGYAVFNRYNEDMEFEELFEYGFTEGVTLNDPVEKGSKVEINIYNEGAHPDITFRNKKIMFRLAKKSVANLDNGNSDIRYDIYGKSNPINRLENEETDESESGDSIGEADEKMSEFYDGSSNYVDVIFDRSSSEGNSIYGGGAKFMYVSGSIVINGLRMDEYVIEAYTMKDADHTTSTSSIDYKVITFSGAKEFEIGPPDITEVNMSSNGVFKITETDVTDFPNISLEVATMMPHRILPPTNANLFENNSLIGTTGTVSRMSELKTESNVTQDVLTSNIEVSESDMSKDFQYPLDIIFCIDNSGSMQNEIDAVKDGLQDFSSKLIENGFDVKFNLITFGPVQNGTYSGGIKPTGDYNVFKYFDGGIYYWYRYGAVYKEKWFDSVDNLETAFDKINAIGGFYYGQENGLTTIKKAIDKLKENGRSIDSLGNIIDDGSGVLPSKKWIIMLTDENADGRYLPYGTNDPEDSDYVISLLVDEMAEDDMVFTNIYHVKKPNVTATNYDDRGISGRYPADQGGIYYDEFRKIYRDNYNMYEMGSTGQHVESGLDASTKDIGIVQFWKFDYETPFSDQDGTERHVNFVLGNIEPELSENLTLTPDDGNIDSDRRYRAPDLSVEIEFITPNPVIDSPEFESSSSDSHFKIKGRVRSVNDSELVPDPPVWVDISIFDHETGDQLNFGNNRDDNLKEEDSSDPDNDWYIFEVEVPKEIIRNSGYTFFDVKADGFLENGNSTSATVTEVKLDIIPPEITSFKVRNLTLENFWKDWPDNDGDVDANYYNFGTGMEESEKAYGKDGDQFQINLKIDEKNLSKVVLEGDLTRLLDTDNYNDLDSNLSWELDESENSISFGSGDLSSNDLILNQGADGKYEIKITATDESGNETVETMEFIVDNTPPVSIELVNDNRVDYSNNGFSIDLENVEDNENGSGMRDIVFGGEYNDKYSDITTPSTIEYKQYISDDGVDESGEASLNQTGPDGRYRFEETATMAGIVAVDKAGNKKVLDDEDLDDFFVDRYLDTVAPRVSNLKVIKVTDGNGISELEALSISTSGKVTYPGGIEDDLYLKNGDKIKIQAEIGEWALKDIKNYNNGGLCYIDYNDFAEYTPNISPNETIEKDKGLIYFEDLSSNTSASTRDEIKIKGSHHEGNSFEIQFQDKAGNSTSGFSFNVALDNTLPKMGNIKPSISWKEEVSSDLKGNKVIPEDYGEKVWYTHSDNFDIKVDKDDYWGNRIKINNSTFSAIDYTTSLVNDGEITKQGLMESNKLNKITVEVIDLAGNRSEFTDNIVLDTKINGTPTLKPDGVIESQTLEISGEAEELSGLYKYDLKVSSGSDTTGTVIGQRYTALDNHYTTPTTENFNAAPTPEIDLDRYKGGRVQVEFTAYDHLGNSTTINREYIVKSQFKIKSSEKDGERQVTTEVDLGGSGGTIDLDVEGRKESGKDD